MFKNLFKLSPILLILIPFLVLSLGGNIFFLVKTGGETDNLKAQISELQKNRDRQKAEKDQIRRFWEDQASLNDSLVSGQIDVLTEVRNYFDEIGRSLRFVNTTPQILPTINQDNLRNAQNNLKDKIEKLEKLPHHYLWSLAVLSIPLLLVIGLFVYFFLQEKKGTKTCSKHQAHWRA